MFVGLLSAVATAAIAAACGSNGGTGASGDGPVDGSPGDGTTGGSSGGGGGGGGDSAADVRSFGNDGSSDDATAGDATGGSSGGSSGGGDGATDAPPDTSSYGCDGCAPFPPLGGPSCTPQTLGAPKLVYPPDGVLLPPNMNVLEVQWVPPQGASLFEVDFENAATDVRVETPCNSVTTVRGAASVGCGLTLSQAEWNNIASLNRDGDPVKVTIRAVPASQQCVTVSAESVSVSFAKEDLAGGIYYWQSATYGGIAGTTGGIYSHDFGTFDPTPTPFYTSGGTGTCVGCHTLSRDGARMSLMTDDPDADDEYGDVNTHVMDVATRTVLGGKNVGPGFQTFTHDHALMIASTFKMGQDHSFAVWKGDGSAQVATAMLPTTNMVQMQGTQPNLSADDKTLVFVAPGTTLMGTKPVSTISMAGDHHFLGGSLWSATFDPGTYALTNFTQFLPSTGQQNFYYPDQSPDGNWVVFNENDDNSPANNNGDCFYSRQARVKMMHFPPQAGDQPLDLPKLNVANGLSNSWPRWSPFVTTYKSHKILWVTFSSDRDYGLHLKNTVDGYPPGSPDGGTGGYDNYYPPESPMYDQPQPMGKQGVTFNDYAAPQIWMAAIVIDTDRTLDATDRSYPAFWLPFQDVTAHNHSAQWVGAVVSTPPPPPPPADGGAGDGGGPGGDGGGDASPPPVCHEMGGTCGSASAACCTDTVCCPGNTPSCQYTCIQ
jgi:hypothetical protein